LQSLLLSHDCPNDQAQGRASGSILVACAADPPGASGNFVGADVTNSGLGG
jgi:hypothetical protein